MVVYEEEEEQEVSFSKKEIFELLKSGKGVYISINGVVVHSTTNTLKEVEMCAVRLIEKFENFLLLKKMTDIKTGQNYTE